MPELATYIGAKPRSVLNGSNSCSRRTRVTLLASGVITLQDNTARGDYVLLTDAEPNKPVAAAAIQAAGKVPALAFESVAVGDEAYTATQVRFSKTAAGGALMGHWVQAASGVGVLGEVELFNPE